MIRPFLLCLLSAGTAGAVTYSADAVVNNPPPTLYYVYRETTPGNVILDNSASIITALQGTAAAAGGNVELFATGDQDPLYVNAANGQPFSTVPRVTLTGTANNAPFVLSSLNGANWFTTTGNAYDISYGVANLANTWFTQFAASVAARLAPALVPLFNANLPSIYSSFLNAGGFTELSDPNISHLYEDAGQFNIGLAGFLDQSPRLRVLLAGQAFVGFIPNGIQFSEVVLVNGVPRYSFAAVPSGVILNDQFGSFNGTYVITAPAPQIPEPATTAILGLLAGAACLRRKR